MTVRLLVLAPHPDDEILGCTGLMTRIHSGGGQVHVVVVTDGGLGGDPVVRAHEVQQGLALLQLPQAECWGHADGGLPMDASIRQRYVDRVKALKPTHLALPSPTEAHPDHRRLTRGVLEALTGIWSGTLVFYETTTPLAQCNHFEPLSLPDKLAAMGQHVSQLGQFNYLQWIQGMAALRGASAGCPAAEGYLSFEWDGSEQNFFEQRPLVSVVIRADDRELLDHALRSVEDQEYDQTEVCVVWHGDLPLPVLPTRLMGCVALGPGGRSANLNFALERVRGEYVAFLDQDDIWASHHLALLVAELQADSRLDLAYGDYERVVCSRQGTEVHVTRREKIETDHHRPGRLMLGNHIPIHAYVCRLRGAQQTGFDDTLQAYEDWDFLLRAELAGLRMRRVEAVVCEYRLFPEAGESGEIDVLHQRKGYLPWRDAVRRKLQSALAPRWFDTLLDLAEDFQHQAKEFRQQADAARTQWQESQAELALLRQQALELHTWADELVPQTAALNPLSRLAGQAFTHGPVIAVLMPVCDPDPAFLTEAVHSVLQQSYPHWCLCLTDDASTSPVIQAMLAQLAHTDPRIRLHTHDQRQGIVAATMSAARMAIGDWMAFVDHDDRLHPDALLEIARSLKQHPQWQALYTDSRTVDRNGVVLNTYAKAEWAPETLLHLNYINHLTAVRRDVFEHIGGLRPGLDGSQDWDLWLRLSRVPGLSVGHISRPLYDWRASETSVAYSLASKPYLLAAACRATEDHLHSLGLTDATSQLATDGGGGLRHRWTAPAQALTVIALTHHNPVDLARLVQSLKASTYPELHIRLVANRVTDTDTQRLLDEVATWPNAEVWEDNRSFNWAALNNAAARRCHTPWLLFLNDDVEWSEPDTLQQLTRYLALDPLVGVVGARLMYGPQEGGDVQHDGVITAADARTVAHNIQSTAQTSGLHTPRNVAAVTGAFLLTTRSVFQRCGGFDERFPVSFNDVDFCLHARRVGYRVVQASDVVAIHHESRTRGHPDTADKQAEIKEAAQRLLMRWGHLLDDTHSLRYQRQFVASHIVRIPSAGDQ